MEGMVFVGKVTLDGQMARFIASASTCDGGALLRAGFDVLADGQVCDEPVVTLSVYFHTQVDAQTRRISGSGRTLARYRLPGAGWDLTNTEVENAGFSRWYETGDWASSRP